MLWTQCTQFLFLYVVWVKGNRSVMMYCDLELSTVPLSQLLSTVDVNSCTCSLYLYCEYRHLDQCSLAAAVPREWQAQLLRSVAQRVGASPKRGHTLSLSLSCWDQLICCDCCSQRVIDLGRTENTWSPAGISCRLNALAFGCAFFKCSSVRS